MVAGHWSQHTRTHTYTRTHLDQLEHRTCRQLEPEQPWASILGIAPHEQLPGKAKGTESRYDVLLRIQYVTTYDREAGQGWNICSSGYFLNLVLNLDWWQFSQVQVSRPTQQPTCGAGPLMLLSLSLSLHLSLTCHIYSLWIYPKNGHRGHLKWIPG